MPKRHAPRQPSAIGNQGTQAQSVDGVPSCDDYQQEGIKKEWHHVSYAEFLMCGISSSGVGHPDPSAAHIPLRPIIDTDRLDAVGISNYHEVVVDSPAFSSSVDAAPSHPQGGDLRPCTNIEQLRRNIADMRQHLALLEHKLLMSLIIFMPVAGTLLLKALG
ncbi:hypothetical protein Nepgr_006621 [Nepenthes gracilis]|uniref:Uncharacterized protein n=1 Tax=Nepenthes gracilis TaxID=150966 RepID=A0AAD3S5K0_NEPGR|nr:hypothetical protein Nepgr_006621 [Nepenthes gracilis]